MIPIHAFQLANKGLAVESDASALCKWTVVEGLTYVIDGSVPVGKLFLGSMAARRLDTNEPVTAPCGGWIYGVVRWSFECNMACCVVPVTV